MKVSWNMQDTGELKIFLEAETAAEKAAGIVAESLEKSSVFVLVSNGGSNISITLDPRPQPAR